MAKRVVATDWRSPAWNSSFSFWPDAKIIPEVATMKAMGVHKVNIRIGCTSPGLFFTDLVEVVAEKKVAVDVIWLKGVRDLCDAMTPALIGELQRVTEPDDDDPDGHNQEEVAMGNYLLYVGVGWRDDEAFMSADFHFAAAEAECGSLMVRRDTRKLPAPPSWGDVTPEAAGRASTAAE